MARNLLTRLALGLAGVVPATSSPTGTPGAPVPAGPSGALLLAQWALFRRGGSVFNQSPVASPTQAPTTTGQITGNLHATDPDGDRLTYAVAGAPTRGTVVVHPDGTYTYTPDAEFTRTGGSDSFTVLVRDNDPGAPGLGRWTDVLRGALGRGHPLLAARLFGSHAVAVTIPVVVAPPAGNTPPVVPTTPPTPTVDRPTGAVTGSLGVRDADGDPLTFTVVEQPGAGTVTLDQATGTYSFTPSEAARRVAAGTPGADTVTFTVLVSDGEGGQTPVEVTVAVDPGPAEVVAAIPVGPGAQSLYASPDGRRIYVVGAGAPAVSTFSAARSFAALDAPTTTGSTFSIIDAGSNTLISTIMLPGRPERVLFSPDGSHAFITTYAGEYYGDGPGAVTVLDTATDTVVTTIDAGRFPRDAVFSADGTRAYVSNYQANEVTVVDLADNTMTTIAVPSPQSLIFSPDGRRIYTANANDGTTTVIDAATNTVIGSVPGYGEPRFGADGRYGYLVDYDFDASTVTVIDTQDDSVTVIPAGREASNIQFGADGAFAYTLEQGGEDRKLTVIDTSDHSWSTIDLGPRPRMLQMSPDGTRGYVDDFEDGTVTVIDTAHGVRLGVIETVAPGVLGGYRDSQFSPDGTRYYVPGEKLTIINTRDDSVTTLDVGGRLGFTPDGSHAYVLGYGTFTGTPLTLISTADDGVRTYEGPAYASSVTFSPDGSRAFLRGGDTVTVLDTVTGTSTAVAVGRYVEGPTFSPDGRQAYLVSYDYGGLDGGTAPAGSVAVIDTTTDVVWTVPTGAFPGQVTFSPDGTRAFVVSDRSATGSTLTVIDRATGTSTSSTGSPYATEVAFTPDGRFGYQFGYGENFGDGDVTFIDLSDGSRAVVPVPAATGMTFSADGRYAYVLNSRDGTATVIALADVAEPSTLA